MPVLQGISSFGGTSYKKLQLDIATSSFISCRLTATFTSADIIFCNFSELDSKLSKKIFCHNFPFFSGFTQTQIPLCPKSAMHDESFLLMLPCLIGLVVNSLQQLSHSPTWIMILQKTSLLFSTRPSSNLAWTSSDRR